MFHLQFDQPGGFEASYYWGIKDSGIVTAKIDEQKTEATHARILELVGRLSA